MVDKTSGLETAIDKYAEKQKKFSLETTAESDIADQHSADHKAP